MRNMIRRWFVWKKKTKRQIKRTGIIFISVTSLVLAYRLGKQIGYDKGYIDKK